MANNVMNISVSLEEPKIHIRLAESIDLESLRRWKNLNREYFFYKEEISEEQQIKWFETLKNQTNNYIFIVEVASIAIGCMGIREIDKNWDVYNVILGNDSYGKTGFMSHAFQSMIQFARCRSSKPVTLQVLKHNPAIQWYKKNGFVIAEEMPGYYCMRWMDLKG